MFEAKRWFTLAVAVAGVACAPMRAPLTSPARGGPAWSELAGEHVVLETDLPPAEARARLAELERMHDVLVAAMGISAPPKAPPVEVVSFERAADFYAVAGATRTKKAYFAERAPGDLEPHALMVMHEDELPALRRITFQHELAHRLIHARYPSLPPWLDEGLAQYFATVEVRGEGILLGDDGNVDFWPRSMAGYSWHGTLQQLNIPVANAPPLAELVTANWQRFYAATARGDDVEGDDRLRQTANYAAAWRLVHFLSHEAAPADRARFRACLQDLERGQRDAFTVRFGAELPRLQEEFTAYLEHAVRRASIPVNVPGRASSGRERILTESEVHLLWARLLPNGAARTADELAAAASADPGSPEPRFRRAVAMIRSRHYDAAAAALDEVLALRPDEARYLYARVVLRELRRERVDRALVEALARSATSASQLEVAARYVGHERLADGLLLVARANAVDPLCWRCQLTRSFLLARGGARDDADTALDRAVALMPETAVPSDVGALRRALAQAAAR